jgi:hypothetical protein
MSAAPLSADRDVWFYDWGEQYLRPSFIPIYMHTLYFACSLQMDQVGLYASIKSLCMASIERQSKHTRYDGQKELEGG